MGRASVVIFVSLLLIFSYLTFNSIGGLPEKIAIHFDANGAADGWTTRDLFGRVAVATCLDYGRTSTPH
jgi:uncharacterized membrane protein